MAKSDGVVPIPHATHSAEVDFTKALDTSSLEGKTILITGGASGLGAGFFKEWAGHGATVIIGDVSDAAGRALVKDAISRTGNQHLHFLQLDVTDWASQVAFFRDAAQLSPHGGIDCVVANAGVGGGPDSEAFEHPPDFAGMTAAAAEARRPKLAVMDINLTGVLYTTTLALSYLARNPGSQKCSAEGAGPGPRDRHLVLVSSMAGLNGLPTLSLYAASKHAVVGLFRSLRITTPLVHGVRVNMLCPYFVVTPILGAAGAFALAGGGVGELASVVDAATRLVADHGVVGRALAVGPKVNAAQAQQAGLEIKDNEPAGERAVWDVYAHDFEQSDVFSRRILGLTNLVAAEKGWSGLLSDLGWAIASPVRRLLGV